MTPEVASPPVCASAKRAKTVQCRDSGRHRELEERLVAVEEMEANDLPEFLTLFADGTLTWSDSTRRLRSAALLFTYVTRGSGSCGEAFLSLGGLTLLGEVLRQAVTSLENGIGLLRVVDFEEDTVMRAFACLKCLQSLPLTQSPNEYDISFSLARLQVLRPAASEEEMMPGRIADLSKGARDLRQRWQGQTARASIGSQAALI